VLVVHYVGTIFVKGVALIVVTFEDLVDIDHGTFYVGSFSDYWS